jgi:anaerobic magnesium-protoporphyrin IX monomethyl ester cyclase
MKITWAATMRADQGVRLPEEVWALCKQSGLRRLLVGVESGSNEMLKRIRKDIKIEQVFETAEKMLRYNIAVHFPFIVGFPD